MAEKPEESLESKISEFEKVMAPEKRAERETLSQKVYDFITDSTKEWLKKKHGIDKTKPGSPPKEYFLGEKGSKPGEYKNVRKDAEDLIKYVGKNLLKYLFNEDYNKDPEKFNGMVKSIEKTHGMIEGLLRTHFGVEVEKLIAKLLQNPENAAAAMNETAGRAAGVFATAIEREAISKIKSYLPEHTSEFYKIAKKKFEERGYGIKLEGLGAEDVLQYMHLVYGEHEEELKKAKSDIYKLDKDKKKK